MIQLVVNTNLLREVDKRKLINTYARLMYNSEEDVENDIIIQNNLESLLDWDKTGHKGLGIYCSKFENLKKKDWKYLISFIKDKKYEIKNIAYPYKKERKSQFIKEILDWTQQVEEHKKEHFTKSDYKPSKRGKPAKTCVYNGKEYSSRQECMYKEGITKNQLYRYLEKTGQV